MFNPWDFPFLSHRQYDRVASKTIELFSKKPCVDDIELLYRCMDLCMYMHACMHARMYVCMYVCISSKNTFGVKQGVVK